MRVLQDGGVHAGGLPTAAREQAVHPPDVVEAHAGAAHRLAAAEDLRRGDVTTTEELG